MVLFLTTNMASGTTHLLQNMWRIFAPCNVMVCGKFLLLETGILGLGILESGIQLKESRIPLTMGIRNPKSTDTESKPVLDYFTRGEFTTK